MSAEPPSRGALLALGVFVLVLIVQRISELILSSRHARVLRARGAVEHGAGHFGLFVAIHALYPIALVWEVWRLGARPGPAWPLWLALYVAAELLRMAVIRSLGEFWNVRIWVVPGMARVRTGPFRWLRHPNYLAVAVELLAGPLIFGAWRTALGITALYLGALAVRIPVEESALAEATARGEPSIR